MGQLTAPPMPAGFEPPVISATRLTVMGGEKGKPGCERKLFGQYRLGMKQASSPALERGSALHLGAEVFQETGDIPEPEGEVGTILASGAHLLGTCGTLAVEYEHWGQFADGTEWIAFLDGSTLDGGNAACVVVQDLKTCGQARYTLVADKASPFYLGRNIQAMFYAWIMFQPHWFAPPLPDGQYGPKHWQHWDPDERRVGSVRLRWVYFLTSGVPRAWDVSVFISHTQAAAHHRDVVAPLVERIRNVHLWHALRPDASLDEIDRTPAACDGRGKWCGVGERDACDMSNTGTPVNELIQLGTNPRKQQMTTPADPNARLAALRARMAGGAAATPAPEAPVPAAPKEEPAAASPEVSSAAAVAAPAAVAVSAGSEPVAETAKPATRGRGRPKAPSAPPAGPDGTPAGINPPEVLEALAKLNAGSDAIGTGPVPGGLQPTTLDLATTEQLLFALARRVLAGAR